MVYKRNFYFIIPRSRICFLCLLDSVLPLVFSVWLVASSYCIQLRSLEILEWFSTFLSFLIPDIPFIESCQMWVLSHSLPPWLHCIYPSSGPYHLFLSLTSSPASPGQVSTPCPHICHTGPKFTFLTNLIISLPSGNLSWFLTICRIKFQFLSIEYRALNYMVSNFPILINM